MQQVPLTSEVESGALLVGCLAHLTELRALVRTLDLSGGSLVNVYTDFKCLGRKRFLDSQRRPHRYDFQIHKLIKAVQLPIRL